LEVQAIRLLDSKPSAKTKSDPLDVLVAEGVTGGVKVLVGVDDGLVTLVGVGVRVVVGLSVLEGVIEGVNVLVGVAEGPLIFVGVSVGVIEGVKVLVGVGVRVMVGVRDEFVGVPVGVVMTDVEVGIGPVESTLMASTSLADNPHILPSKYSVGE